MNEIIEYKGYTIEIERDEINESPDEWGNTDLFLVSESEKHLWIARKGFMSDDEGSEERGRYHEFPLYAYIHSGITLALTPFSCPFDSGRIGTVFVEKSCWECEAEAGVVALSLVETWKTYLSGEIYCYDIKDDEGEVIDSLCGIYGYEDAVLTAQEAVDFIRSQPGHQLELFAGEK